VLDDARTLAVAHYGCGAISVFDLDADGMPGVARVVQRHQGGAVRSPRQADAHPHCVVATTNAAYVTDLGQDRIVVYSADLRAQHSFTPIHPGAGPRHLCVDESRGCAWLSNELDNTVSWLALRGDGALVEIGWCSTLPRGDAGHSAVSEVALHPNGRWLYVGNRGHDSIAWFDIASDGALRWCGVQSTGGRHPRHFSITGDGAWLVVANRDSDTLCALRIEPTTGQPVPAGAAFAGVPAPVCVRWL
jgi:6-phosphogluconolactonase